MRVHLLVIALALLMLLPVPPGGANCHFCAGETDWPDAAEQIFRFLYRHLP